MTDSPEPGRSAEEDAEILARERAHYLGRLREIPRERARLEERERDLARYLRSIGVGWDEIGAAAGMTGEAALEKFGEPPPGDAPFLGHAWHDRGEGPGVVERMPRGWDRPRGLPR